MAGSVEKGLRPVTARKINCEIYFLFMINAPMTPGTHPQRVRRNTIRIDPQPLSMTARGGQIMQIITRKQPMGICEFRFANFDLLIYKNSLLPIHTLPTVWLLR
jgi:hypothetical protein